MVLPREGTTDDLSKDGSAAFLVDLGVGGAGNGGQVLPGCTALSQTFTAIPFRDNSTEHVCGELLRGRGGVGFRGLRAGDSQVLQML